MVGSVMAHAYMERLMAIEELVVMLEGDLERGDLAHAKARIVKIRQALKGKRPVGTVIVPK